MPLVERVSVRRVRPPLETYYDGSNPGPAGAPWTPPPGMGRKTARQRCPLLRPSDDNGSDQDNTAKVYEGALPALHSGRSGSWETAWRSSTPAAPPTRAGTPAGAAAPAPPVRHLVGTSVRPPAPLQGDGPYMGASGPQRCGGLHGETLHRGSPAPLCEPKTLNPAPLRGSSPPPVQPLPDSSHGRTPRRAARTSDSPPRAAGARRKGPRANL